MAEITATGPNGETAVWRDGDWQILPPSRIEGAAAFDPSSDTDVGAGALATQAIFEARRQEGNDIAKTVGSELLRTPAHLAGLPSAALGAAETVGTAIGDAARWATGKAPREGPAPDPLGLRNVQEALPTSEGIRKVASDVTGVELHDPTTTPGKVAGVVTDLLAGGRGVRTGVLKPKGELPPLVPMASKPASPVVRDTIKAAKEEAGASGKQLAQTLRPQLKALLADPAQMARFSPTEQAIMQDIARGGWTEKIAALVGKLNSSSPLAQLLNLSTAGTSGFVGAIGRGLASHATSRNIKILNAIVGGAAG